MCGIAGFWLRDPALPAEELRARVLAMAATLQRRGPDGEGAWVDAAAGVALGHRRLAVVDLSDAGAQPMASADGRWQVTYNGEIYNHRELAGELAAAGVRFRGHCDTEVLVEGCALWGAPRLLARLEGMYALALWDRQERALWLARDAFGKKPLYYGETGDGVVFASELKALHALPGFAPAVDEQAIADFLRLGHVPAPRSVYRGIAKLGAGRHVVLRAPRADAAATPHFDFAALVRDAAATPFEGDEEGAADAVEQALSTAVRRRMLADVPVGALLSGGVDSSLVVALMQRAAARPVLTFSVGFDDGRYDESAHAAAVARQLGTEHTEVRVTEREALDVVPGLPDLYDEPFADSSQVPTHLVARVARRAVTVALSGDGGDESFGGYYRHIAAAGVARVLNAAPFALRRPAGRLLAGPAARFAAVAWPRIAPLLPAARRPKELADRLRKLGTVLGARDLDAAYDLLVGQGVGAARLAGPALAATTAWVAMPPGAPAEPAARFMFADTLGYLPDDVLAKVDRASMATSLEVRSPLLDRDVVRLAWRLPLSMRVGGGVGKRVLRRVLARHVSGEHVERAKAGFAVPLADWLRGPLRDWAQALLDAPRLRESGWVDASALADLWRRHQAGEGGHQHLLWNVLMLAAWQERWTT